MGPNWICNVRHWRSVGCDWKRSPVRTRNNRGDLLCKKEWRCHALLKQHKNSWKSEIEGQSYAERNVEGQHSIQQRKNWKILEATVNYSVEGAMATSSETTSLSARARKLLTCGLVPRRGAERLSRALVNKLMRPLAGQYTWWTKARKALKYWSRSLRSDSSTAGWTESCAIAN